MTNTFSLQEILSTETIKPNIQFMKVKDSSFHNAYNYHRHVGINLIGELVFLRINDNNIPSKITNDGLLGNMISSQIIITYNIDNSKIDSAILRPGRLMFEKEFSKYTKNQAQKVIDLLNSSIEAKDDLSLADIYSYTKDAIEPSSTKHNMSNSESAIIGFC